MFFHSNRKVWTSNGKLCVFIRVKNEQKRMKARFKCLVFLFQLRASNALFFILTAGWNFVTSVTIKTGLACVGNSCKFNKNRLRSGELSNWYNFSRPFNLGEKVLSDCVWSNQIYLPPKVELWAWTKGNEWLVVCVWLLINGGLKLIWRYFHTSIDNQMGIPWNTSNHHLHRNTMGNDDFVQVDLEQVTNNIKNAHQTR